MKSSRTNFSPVQAHTVSPLRKKKEKSKLLNRPLGISLFFLRLFLSNRRRKRKRQMIGCQNSSLSPPFCVQRKNGCDIIPTAFSPKKKTGEKGLYSDSQHISCCLGYWGGKGGCQRERRKKRLVCLALFCAPYFFCLCGW